MNEPENALALDACVDVSSSKVSISTRLSRAFSRSFYGTRGSLEQTVITLRGSTGADFEGYATVARGVEDSVLGVFGLSNMFTFGHKKNDLCLLLIKGHHCFVFNDEKSKSPKYAIDLMNRKAVIQPSHESFIPRIPHPGAEHDTTYTTIHLETGLGDIDYKLTFANMEDGLASRFCNAVSVASNEASTEQIRKRLGHDKLTSKRASVRNANAIGANKTKDQPDAPIGPGEVLAGMPSVPC